MAAEPVAKKGKKARRLASSRTTGLFWAWCGRTLLVRAVRGVLQGGEVRDLTQGLLGRHIVKALPQGHDTALEQWGGNLSVGQRQQISFARALVADAEIMTLDAATADVDSHTELLVPEVLVRLPEGRTALVIAHRLATIRRSDRIVVLQDGRVIETDSHAELMAAKGLFAGLYRLNDASFDDMPT